MRPAPMIYDDRGNLFLAYPDANHLAVYVHGFNGAEPGTYWSRVIELFRGDAALVRTNFLFFGYHSNASLFPNIGSYFSAQKPLQPIDRIADTLRDETLLYLKNFGTGRISFCGHSLGGHIAIAAAVRLLDKVEPQSIRAVGLIAAPNTPPKQAYAHRVLSFGRNAHTKYLASHSAIRDMLVNNVTTLRTSGVRIEHLYSLDDVFSAPRADISFDGEVNIQANHSWLKDLVGPADTRYQRLASWTLTGSFS